MSSLKNEAALPWGRSLTHLVWCILLICRLCINRFEYLGMPSLWLMDFRWSSRHDWKWLLVMSGRCSKVFWRPCMTSREPAIFVPTRLVDGLWNFNLIIWGIHLVLEQIHQRYWEPTLLQTSTFFTCTWNQSCFQQPLCLSCDIWFCPSFQIISKTAWPITFWWMNDEHH